MRLIAKSPLGCGLAMISCCVLACGPGNGTTPETGPSTSSETASETASETETSVSMTETETETGPDPCELETYAECYTEPLAALSVCLDACGCGELACRDLCHEAYEQAYWACLPEDHGCSDVFDWDAYSACYDTCFTIRIGDCTDAGCDDHMCSHDFLWCVERCRGCPAYAEFEFPYMDSCVIELPGELPPLNVPYVSVEIEGMQIGLGWSGADMCDDTFAVLWNADYTGFELCPDACMQFADAGAVVVDVGAPACE